MSNPNSALYWLAGLICCPAPIAFVLGLLAARAFQSGWVNFRVDRSRAPRIGRHDAE
jgi:hypothetical protein